MVSNNRVATALRFRLMDSAEALCESVYGTLMILLFDKG